MELIVDLVQHLEEQQALHVQHVQRPRNLVVTVLEATALRAESKKRHLQVRPPPSCATVRPWVIGSWFIGQG